MKTKIWAHRGASAYAPENTLSAFKLAMEQGAEGIELDVHLSADGEVVVTHDHTIDRVSNEKGLVNSYTVEELKGFDFSNHFSEYKGEKIPTLKEVYELVKPTDLKINVELKTGIVMYEGIEKKLIELAEKMEMQERVIYSSFNHYSLMKLKELSPTVELGILYADGWIDVPSYAKNLGVQAIHPSFYNLEAPNILEKCKEYSIDINVWTVDKEEMIKKMLDYEVHAIITNKPDLVAKIRGSAIL